MPQARVRLLSCITAVAAIASVCVTPRVATAQASVGVFAGAEFDNQNNWILYGAEARMPVANDFDANLRYSYHPYGSGASASQVDLNALYNWPLAHPGMFAPYVGIGGAYVHFSATGASDNKVGLNLVSGTKVILNPTSPIQPFVNTQYTIVRSYPNSYTLDVGISYLFGHARKTP